MVHFVGQTIQDFKSACSEFVLIYKSRTEWALYQKVNQEYHRLFHFDFTFQDPEGNLVVIECGQASLFCSSECSRGCPGNPGPPGKPGTPGTNGFPGNPGINGLNGSSGEDGNSGISGPSGFPGPSGASGNSGKDGNPGDPGRTGERFQGLPGLPGSEGPLGFQGDQGLLGFAGNEGSKGIPGSRGIQGLEGFSGKTGERGFPGVSGKTGVSGGRGVSGSSGVSGYSGLEGPSGYPGISGISGSKGLSGISGLRGLSGPSGNSGPSGETGNSGSAGNKGIPGSEGSRGETGNPGPVGPPGKDGFPGRNGSEGAPGNVGELGLPGSEGEQGLPGVPGETGLPGRQGLRGLPGTPGEKGPSGHPGISGKRGLQGKMGPSGERGPPGPSGLPAMSGNSAFAFLWNTVSGVSGRYDGQLLAPYLPGISTGSIVSFNNSLTLGVIPDPQTSLIVETEGYYQAQYIVNPAPTGNQQMFANTVPFVGVTAASLTPSSTVTLELTPNSGSSVYVCIQYNTVISVIDDAGNIYNQATYDYNLNVTNEIWYSDNIALNSSNSINVTVSGNGEVEVELVEIIGANKVNSLGYIGEPQDYTFTGDGSFPVSINLRPSQKNELGLISLAANTRQASITGISGGPYTTILNTNPTLEDGYGADAVAYLDLTNTPSLDLVISNNSGGLQVSLIGVSILPQSTDYSPEVTSFQLLQNGEPIPGSRTFKNYTPGTGMFIGAQVSTSGGLKEQITILISPNSGSSLYVCITLFLSSLVNITDDGSNKYQLANSSPISNDGLIQIYYTDNIVLNENNNLNLTFTFDIPKVIYYIQVIEIIGAKLDGSFDLPSTPVIVESLDTSLYLSNIYVPSSGPNELGLASIVTGYTSGNPTITVSPGISTTTILKSFGVVANAIGYLNENSNLSVRVDFDPSADIYFAAVGVSIRPQNSQQYVVGPTPKVGVTTQDSSEDNPLIVSITPQTGSSIYILPHSIGEEHNESVPVESIADDVGNTYNQIIIKGKREGQIFYSDNIKLNSSSSLNISINFYVADTYLAQVVEFIGANSNNSFGGNSQFYNEFPENNPLIANFSFSGTGPNQIGLASIGSYRNITTNILTTQILNTFLIEDQSGHSFVYTDVYSELNESSIISLSQENSDSQAQFTIYGVVILPEVYPLGSVTGQSIFKAQSGDIIQLANNGTQPIQLNSPLPGLPKIVNVTSQYAQFGAEQTNYSVLINPTEGNSIYISLTYYGPNTFQGPSDGVNNYSYAAGGTGPELSVYLYYKDNIQTTPLGLTITLTFLNECYACLSVIEIEETDRIDSLNGITPLTNVSTIDEELATLTPSFDSPNSLGLLILGEYNSNNNEDFSPGPNLEILYENGSPNIIFSGLYGNLSNNKNLQVTIGSGGGVTTYASLVAVSIKPFQVYNSAVNASLELNLIGQ